MKYVCFSKNTSLVFGLQKSQASTHLPPSFLVNTSLSLVTKQQHPLESVCPTVCKIVVYNVQHMVSFSASVRWRLVAYFDLSLLAGLGADRLDDVTVVTPDFLIVDSQATLIPAANVDVGKPVFPDLLEVHNFISGGIKKSADNCYLSSSSSFFLIITSLLSP